MIAVAGAFLLLGLGLFVAGLLTGVTAYYWACVAACAVSAGVLVVARRDIASRSAGTAAGAGGREPAPAVPAAPAVTGPDLATGATATVQPVAEPAPVHAAPAAPAPVEEPGEPPLEVVEVTDLLIVVDLTDEVLVVDEHPRYHVEGCRYLRGRSTIPLPLDEARTDGFTPCGACRPDRTLAQRVRARRSSAGA